MEGANLTFVYQKFMYLLGFIAPFSTLPQIETVWVNKSVEGIAISTWVMFTINAFFWTLYGLMKKDKPTILTNILWAMMQLIVLLGVVIF